MKLLIFISILSSFLIQQQSQLNGKYRMEYEEDYTSQNSTIEFKNNSYKRKLSNGKIVKGTVVYQDFVIQLNDYKSNLRMDFLKSDIQKDTIFFGTKDLSEKSINDMDMTIYAGKLIRVK
jgi:hypothetical protein